MKPKNKKRKRLPAAAEEAYHGGKAMAEQTRGRARVFSDRRKATNRNACRKFRLDKHED